MLRNLVLVGLLCLFVFGGSFLFFTLLGDRRNP